MARNTFPKNLANAELCGLGVSCREIEAPSIEVMGFSSILIVAPDPS
jgi:hypothetical protein